MSRGNTLGARASVCHEERLHEACLSGESDSQQPKRKIWASVTWRWPWSFPRHNWRSCPGHGKGSSPGKGSVTLPLRPLDLKNPGFSFPTISKLDPW